MLWCDNTNARALATNMVFHARMKHIEIDVHDKVLSREIRVGYVPTADQMANFFAKAITRSRFSSLRRKLGCVRHPFI